MSRARHLPLMYYWKTEVTDGLPKQLSLVIIKFEAHFSLPLIGYVWEKSLAWDIQNSQQCK